MNRSNAFSPNNPPSGSPGVTPPSGTPDNGWASAFQDASEAPPARVWSGIERQLDLDDEDGVLPLYPYATSRSVVFGRWAAGVAAACLLALLGWWNLRSDEVNTLKDNVLTVERHPESARPATASAASVASAARPAGASVARQEGYAAAKTAEHQPGIETRTTSATPPIASSQPDALASVGLRDAAPMTDSSDQFEATESVTISMQVSVQQTTRLASGADQAVRPTTLTRVASNQPAPVSETQTQLSFSQSMRSSFVQSTTGRMVVPPTSTQVAGAVQSIPSPASEAVAASVINKEQVALYEQLTPMIQPLVIREMPKQVVGNERIVWFSPEVPQSETGLNMVPKTARKGRQKAWISAGMMASSFNPLVAMRPVSGLAYTNNSAANNFAVANSGPVPALALDSRAGRATAMQLSIGVPLSDHWTIESGVGLLTGQSVVQSPVRSSAVLADKNNTVIPNAPTLYTDLLGSSASQAVANSALDGNGYVATAQRNAFVASTSYNRSVLEGVSNNYQFVQVPVQLSYELRPRRKFGLAFLTGMVSNLFVRNTIDAATIKQQDGVYRPLTMAGTAGMRLRFRPDKHWSASLAGTFQQSLYSITRPDVGVQSVPQNVGVSFSVDRHF